MPVGVGTGSGLSERQLGDAGGEEDHQLSEGEMPSHVHSVHSHLPFVALTGEEPIELPNPLPESTGSTGGDQAHNNMPPYLALNFFIFTG